MFHVKQRYLNKYQKKWSSGSGGGMWAWWNWNRDTGLAGGFAAPREEVALFERPGLLCVYMRARACVCMCVCLVDLQLHTRSFTFPVAFIFRRVC